MKWHVLGGVLVLLKIAVSMRLPTGIDHHDEHEHHDHHDHHDQIDDHGVCDASVIGWNSAPRPNFDQSGGSVVFSGKPIQCDGEVSQWMYWAKASQSFKAVVYRPTNVATRFTVVGINEIPAGAVDEAVVYTVPKGQRIEVHEGDVIGLSYSDAGPQISWTADDGPEAAEVEVQWNQDSDPSDDDMAEMTGRDDHSQWSFSAIVTAGTGVKDAHQVLARGKALLQFLALFPDVE